jgi:hypothetical protein
MKLAYNSIGEIGAIALAKALQSGKCMVGLQIDLGVNNVGDRGEIAITEALQSGQW